jgi:hypothetical protein
LIACGGGWLLSKKKVNCQILDNRINTFCVDITLV